MTNRLEFIEDDNLRHQPDLDETDVDEVINYPILARYDFLGKGPRPGNSKDSALFTQAAELETKGEKLKPIVIRVAWILIRLAFGLAFLYFFVYGNTFNCGGTGYLMD